MTSRFISQDCLRTTQLNFTLIEKTQGEHALLIAHEYS